MDGHRKSDSIGMEQIDTLDIAEVHLLVLHHRPVLHLVRLQRTDKSVVHNSDMALLATLLHLPVADLQSIGRYMENVDRFHSKRMDTVHTLDISLVRQNHCHRRHSHLLQVHLRCLQRYQDYFLILPVDHSVAAKK